LLGNFLRTQVLLDGQRVVGAALHCGIVADNHAIHTADTAHTGDQTGTRRRVFRSTFAVFFRVHAHRCQGCYLQEWGTRVEQHVNAVARQQFAARGVLGTCRLATTERHLGNLHAQVVYQHLHGLGIGLEVSRAGVEFGLQCGHVCLVFAIETCAIVRSTGE
jgi:hypothetical protein